MQMTRSLLGSQTALILCATLLSSVVQAQPRFNDPRVVAERMQVAGVSRCISLLVVWSAGLVKAPNIRADGPEIRSNNALMEVYGNARRHLIASSGNPAMSGAIDGMVRQQGEYFGNIVRFQGWDAIIPEYRQCAAAAQVAAAVPQAPARAATPAAPVAPPAQSSSAGSTPSPAASETSAIDGNWYSKEWRYGYALRNGVGKATSTNSPNFQVGQEILFLKPSGDGAFSGRQVYTDGKFYAVTAVLQPNGELHFSGERNVRWVMRRID